MPTVPGLVYVAVWIDPQPQPRLGTGPHPVVNISDIIQLHGSLCVYTRVCAWTTRIYGDPTTPRHGAAHLDRTAPSRRRSGSVRGSVACSCPSAETRFILFILSHANNQQINRDRD